MRYDREITYLLAEGIKGVACRAAAAELIHVLLTHKPTAEELDALEAKIAGEAGEDALVAYRELRRALGFERPSQAE
jgi:hypothetical protein